MTHAVYPGCAIPPPPAAIIPATPENFQAILAAAKPGDAIQLASGAYGALNIEAFNPPGFVTIEAEPEATPIFASWKVRNSSCLVFSGLTVQGLLPLPSGYAQLGYFAACHDIVVTGCTFISQTDVSGWTQADWVALAPDGLQVFVRDVVNNECIAITDNVFRNLKVALNASADHLIIDSNRIDGFGHDAINTVGGDHLRITNNTAVNSHDIGTGNHNDLFQSSSEYFQGFQPERYWFTDWEISGNAFIAQTGPIPHPADNLEGRTGVQGIGFSMARNVRIANNTIIVPNANGVWGGPVYDVTIERNIVLSSAHIEGQLAWIGNFANAANITVQNNTTAANPADVKINVDQPSKAQLPPGYAPGQGIVTKGNLQAHPQSAP